MILIGEKCVGCGKCVNVCPFGALSLVNKKAVCSSACTMCRTCEHVCPVKCISMPEKKASTYVKQDISKYKGVWVFLETYGHGSKIRGVGYDLLSKGRELADALGEELCAVVIGTRVSEEYPEISAHGADKIYAVMDTKFLDYNTDAYSEAIIQLIGKYLPSIMLFPSTYVGRDLAPRISAEIVVGLTADCTGLTINADKNLVQTRPAFGGNIMADILCPNHRPQMATVRPGVFKRVISRPGSKAEVINETVSISENAKRIKVLNTHLDPIKTEDSVSEADVVICGGRGMKNAEGFAILEDLAGNLGGAVGATRAAVDLGLKEKDKQIGQSGITVSPKLYVACGISGAVQHTVGMENSDTIIAINKDPKAPIFNFCKIGLVGDASQILPRVIQEIKNHKKQ